MALALGAQVTLVTRLSPGYDTAPLEGIEVHAQPAADVCRYANRFDSGGDRTLLLLNEGEPIDTSDITFPTPADAMIVAPAYHEIGGLPPCEAPVVAVALQGPLRTCDGQGLVMPHPRPKEQVASFLRPGVVAFFSEEDTTEPEDLAHFIASGGGTALLTRGWRGAILVTQAGARVLPPYSANPVDPTGAGDCFATAFVVRYIETGDLDEASHYALAAGALAVEAPGLAGVATRAQVEERVLREAA
jgi:hypothetical protein